MQRKKSIEVENECYYGMPEGIEIMDIAKHKWVIRKFKHVSSHLMACSIEKKLHPNGIAPNKAHYLLNIQSGKLIARITHDGHLFWGWVAGGYMGVSYSLKNAKQAVLEHLESFKV